MTGCDLGRNIRKLREMRQMTQEQLAQALNISFQAVSKWETCVTVPDTLMLPQIAAYFDVTIDELFRPEPGPYANKAQRLLALYEASHDQNDFIRAEAEFRKLFAVGAYTRDDERMYGILHEYHMYYCRDMALKQYEKILAGPERDMVYRSTRLQRIWMLSKIGRGTEVVEEERARVLSEPDDPQNHLALLTALSCAELYEEVMTAFEQAQSRFGEIEAEFYLDAGDACGKLGRYDEAFAYWDRALEVDPEHIGALFSIAFCLHERGEYAREADIWERIIDWHTKRGYIHELAYPREQLRQARELCKVREENC